MWLINSPLMPRCLPILAKWETTLFIELYDILYVPTWSNLCLGTHKYVSARSCHQCNQNSSNWISYIYIKVRWKLRAVIYLELAVFLFQLNIKLSLAWLESIPITCSNSTSGDGLLINDWEQLGGITVMTNQGVTTTFCEGWRKVGHANRFVIITFTVSSDLFRLCWDFFASCYHSAAWLNRLSCFVLLCRGVLPQKSFMLILYNSGLWKRSFFLGYLQIGTSQLTPHHRLTEWVQKCEIIFSGHSFNLFSGLGCQVPQHISPQRKCLWSSKMFAGFGTCMFI